MHPMDIITFWFEEITPSDWFKKNSDFDQMLRDRFSTIHTKAKAGELSFWRDTAAGRLAEIIILDQFSRNMFRDMPAAFQTDSQSLTLAQEAIRAGADKQLPPVQRKFLYMPFMHSESLKIQEEGIELFTDLGIEDNLKFMIAHRDVIAKFGRFPHRNAILGRESSAEELDYIQSGGGF